MSEHLQENLKLIFVLHDGTERACLAKSGETVLTVAHKNDIDLEGACEGSLACSTCHVILDKAWFDKLGGFDGISDAENDMLDLAFGLEETSRLGCQIVMTKELSGLKVKLPRATRNISAGA